MFMCNAGLVLFEPRYRCVGLPILPPITMYLSSALNSLHWTVAFVRTKGLMVEGCEKLLGRFLPLAKAKASRRS